MNAQQPSKMPVWSLLAVLSAVPGAWAAAAEHPLQMSPFEVSANSVEFRGWDRHASPHFVLYTDAKPSEGDRLLRQMEMLHQMAQGYFRREAIRRAPMMFILPTARSDWRKIESKSGVQWNVAISDPAHTLVDLIVAHYDWQQSLRLVFHELGRAELRWLNLPEPLWFQRGVMGFFGAAKLDRDKVTLGQMGLNAQDVAHHGWLPWDAVFKVTFQSPEYVREDKIGRLNGQSMIFVQYLLAHADPVWVERLLEWLSITEAGTAIKEEEFACIFGEGWQDWQRTLDGYLRSGSYRVSSLGFTSESLNITTTRLTPPVREMRELFVLTQILNQTRAPESQQALTGLLSRGLRTESLRELLVEACLALGHAKLALVELRKLIAAGTNSPDVLALAAELEFNARMPKFSLEVKVESEEARAWAAQALELEPRHRVANRVAAWFDALAPKIDNGKLESIKHAYRRLSGEAATGHVVAALAVAMHRAGEHETARAMAQKLVESPYSEREVQAIGAELLAALGIGIKR